VLSAAVVGRTPAEIDAGTRATVADWIAREQRQWPGPRDEILQYLADHGSATEHEVVLKLESVESRLHIRPTLARLVRTGRVDRDDRDGESALFSPD
jgi:hypothetical protein